MNMFKSRTFWTLVFAFVFNGFSAISGSVSPEVVTILNAIFLTIGSYFHINPSQQYNTK